MTKAELIIEVTDLILTGGRRTTAANVRKLITDLINSYEDIKTYQNGIMAFSGGGKSGATPLTKNFNRIDFVVTTGDSILLPDAIAGTICIIQNYAINDLIFYAKGSNFIILDENSETIVQDVLVGGNKIILFCYSNGEWSIQ